MQLSSRVPWRATALAATLVLATACENQITQVPPPKAASEAPQSDKAPYKQVFALEPLIGGGGSNSVAYDVNDLGQAVGYSTLAVGSHAVIWDNSTIPQDLGTLDGGSTSNAAAISNSGTVVVGNSTDGSGFSYPVRWLKVNGQWTIDRIGPAGCYANSVSSDGTAIGMNCAGYSEAYVWINGRLQILGVGQVYGVNSFGQAVGTNSSSPQRALRWTFSGGNVTVTDLGTLGGAYAVALSINDAGEVSGWSERADHVSHAYFWSPKKGTMLDLGLSGVTGGGYHVNAQGQVVGDMFPPPSYEQHAAFYNGGKVVDLGAVPGYTRAIAWGINNNGVIVGYSYDYTLTTYRATMWVLK